MNVTPVPGGNRLIDYAPAVIDELRKQGPLNQGDLTEAVWGTSGRGNTSLTQTLFPWMVARGMMKMTQKGRTKLFSLPEGA